MRYSLNFLVPLIILTAPVAGLAQSRTYSNVGRTPSEEEIRSLGIIVGPEGKELPPGRGTAKEGAELFAKQCSACHGKDGQGGVANKLVTGSPGNPHRGPFKDNEGHPIAYWAYATTVWDYINRAMPANKGGTLSPDEVYAVTAFLLYKNGIVQESDVMDAQSLPKIEMPNRNNFVPEVPVWPPNPKKPSWY
jgi:mono/diheme cytochrome c family protein